MDELDDRVVTPVGDVIALMQKSLAACANWQAPVGYLRRYEELLILRERLLALRTYVYTDPLSPEEQLVVQAVNEALGELLTYLRELLRPRTVQPGGGLITELPSDS